MGVLTAAKSGNEQSVATAKAAFFANGDQVAAFLHGANPKHWPLADMLDEQMPGAPVVIALAIDRAHRALHPVRYSPRRHIRHLVDAAKPATGIMGGILRTFL